MTPIPLVPYQSRPIVSTAAACEMLSIRKTKLYDFLAAGDLTSVRRGSRRYIFADSPLALVRAWRDQEEDAGDEAALPRPEGTALQAGSCENAN
jgi:hypothetical protein